MDLNQVVVKLDPCLLILFLLFHMFAIWCNESAKYYRCSVFFTVGKDDFLISYIECLQGSSLSPIPTFLSTVLKALPIFHYLSTVLKSLPNSNLLVYSAQSSPHFPLLVYRASVSPLIQPSCLQSLSLSPIPTFLSTELESLPYSNLLVYRA
ncbi:hypothetical protein RRG08_017896 [Elysia crispata]|uniref:Uncharacterized protein n=1 Tax=Elysia crispata TaxID=231223 RepID=A0AAE1DVX3_9GAST|nr:hypothetical protein RRG08_017896 [Elysia crispata]